MTYVEASKILGIAVTHTVDERKKAYRAIVKKYHPDVNPSPSAEEIMRNANEAFEYLNTHEPEVIKSLTHLSIFNIINN